MTKVFYQYVNLGVFIRYISYYNYCVSGHYPSSCYYLQHPMFQRLGSVSIFRWNLLSWAQSIQLVPISRHQQQHKTGYINPTADSWSVKGTAELGVSQYTVIKGRALQKTRGILCEVEKEKYQPLPEAVTWSSNFMRTRMMNTIACVFARRASNL
jgi:hypothetical protein